MKNNWYQLVLIIGMIYWENSYFGWKMKPSSDNELICDLIITLACVVAIGQVKKDA